MAEQINPELISLKQLAQLINPLEWQKEYATIRKRAQRGKYKTYQLIEGAGYININDSEIPVSVKISFTQNSASSLLLRERESLQINDCRDLINQIPTNNELSPKKYSFAIAAAKLINSFIDHSNLPENKGNKTKAQEKFVNAYNNGAFEDIYKIIGERNVQTIRTWKAKYINAKKDYRVLAPLYPEKKPGCVTPEEEDILVKLFLHPNARLITEVVHDAIDIFIAKRFPHIRSFTTYKRHLENWAKENNGLTVFCREGEQALDDKVLPYLERDWNRIPVGRVLIMDGHVNNFLTINPESGKPARMMTIAGIDGYSQFLCGYEVSPVENVKAISVAIFRCTLTLGDYWDTIYFDNGKAFGAKYFHGDEFDNLLPLFKRLGAKVIFAKPYHGQSKPIEPFWGWLAELERMMPSYTGTSIEMKPAHMNRGEKLHRTMFEGSYQHTNVDIFQTYRAIDWWLEKYHNRIKTGGHLKGKTPAQAFNAGKGSGIDIKDLTYLMMEPMIKSLYRKGIQLANRWYWHEKISCERYISGTNFLIRADLIFRESIFVYDMQGEFICRAFDIDQIHPLADIYGTDEEVAEYHKQLAVKEQIKKHIVSGAKQILKNKIYPEHNRQLKDANILAIPSQEGPGVGSPEADNQQPTTKKRKRSITDLWAMPEDKKAKNIDITSKAAEA